MRVLITNDDGVFADGLRALVDAVSQVAEVLVIAPERQQSATGHAITLHKPLRLEPVTLPGTIAAYASNGTPADCVILASASDLPHPDMVLSGINAGANLGEEVLYSGTVSAAMEGALQGLPSLAISVASYTDVLYAGAAQFTGRLVEALAKCWPLPPDTFFNLNFPNVAPEVLKAPLLTRLGRRKYTNVLSKRLDPRGRPYYWFSGSPVESDCADGTDIQAVQEGHISLTPVHFDLTGDLAHDQLPDFFADLANMDFCSK
jgi:5'-nucleotidase